MMGRGVATYQMDVTRKGGIMRRAIPLVLALTLFATACSSGSSDDSVVETSTTVPSSTSSVTPTSVVSDTTTSVVSGGSEASPLVIVAVDFETGVILIRNDGDEDYDLAGHWICNRPTYSELPAEVLAPGTIIEIDTAAIGLDADSGEIALYTSRDFGSADDILRYVQWGTDSHGRTAVAVAGGVWQDGDFVDNQGANIESTGSGPISASDWSSS
jgi:hypothetical protein